MEILPQGHSPFSSPEQSQPMLPETRIVLRTEALYAINASRLWCQNGGRVRSCIGQCVVVAMHVKWMSNRTIMKDIRRLYIDQMLNRRRGVTFTHKWWLTLRSILIKLVILYIYICNLENGFLVIDYLIFGYLMTIVY